MGSNEVNGPTANFTFKSHGHPTSPNTFRSGDSSGQPRQRLGRNTLRGPEQRQLNAALHQLAHRRHEHSGRRRCRRGGGRDCRDQRNVLWRRSGLRPCQGGQTAEHPQRQWTTVHDYCWRRDEPVRVPDQQRQPVRVHLGQRVVFLPGELDWDVWGRCVLRLSKRGGLQLRVDG